MSESKSNIISFRLPAELIKLAQEAAIATGDKNASAWCQKLVINALLKSSDQHQNDKSESTSQLDEANDLVKALTNLRQLNIDCFELLLKDGENSKEFVQIAITSEEDWESISEGISKSVVKEPSGDEGLGNTNYKSINSEPFTEPETLKNQVDAEKVSNEFLIFAKEIENEVAVLVGDEQRFRTLQNGNAFELDDLSKTNQMLKTDQIPNLLPLFNLSEQVDIGKTS